MNKNKKLPDSLRLERKVMNAAIIAWIVVGGLGVVASLAVLIREIPSLRRELRLLKM